MWADGRNCEVMQVFKLMSGFTAHWQNFRNRLFASSCLFVRIEQVDPHWTEYREVLCLRILRISVDEIKVLLTSDKYNGHLTSTSWNTYYNISLNSPYNEQDKNHTHTHTHTHAHTHTHTHIYEYIYIYIYNVTLRCVHTTSFAV